MIIATDDKFTKLNLMDVKNIITYKTTEDVRNFTSTKMNLETLYKSVWW